MKRPLTWLRDQGFTSLKYATEFPADRSTPLFWSATVVNINAVRISEQGRRKPRRDDRLDIVSAGAPTKRAALIHLIDKIQRLQGGTWTYDHGVTP